MLIEITCDNCNELFMKEKKYVNLALKRNYKLYCTRKCSAIAKSKRIISECACCGKEISLAPSHNKKTKDGIHFCSKTCTTKIRKLGNNNAYKDGSGSYRARALKHYGSICRICGYDIEPVLEVHHKDHNRENNELENLDVLCPTHHTEYQLGIRIYT